MCGKSLCLSADQSLPSCQEQTIGAQPSSKCACPSIIRARLRLSHLPTALPLHLDRRGQSCCECTCLFCTTGSLQTQDSCIEARIINFAAIVRSVYTFIASLVKKLAAGAFVAVLSCYL